MGPNSLEIEHLKEQLGEKFCMKDLGPVSWYLGMRITRDRQSRTIYVDQTTYGNRLISSLGMESCKVTRTPMEVGIELRKDMHMGEVYAATKDEIQGYQSLVGALLWVVCMTRPDIALAVGKCSRYATNPTPTHDLALKRIVRYLAGSAHLGLRYGPSNEINVELVGYTDSSYGDCLDTRRSTSGYTFLFWNGPITWSSKRQLVVALSTAESEYIGECNAAKEAIFLSRSLTPIGYDISTLNLFADNQAAIKLASNLINHPRSKHIDIQYHKVREVVENGLLQITYIPTADMVADGLTKSLDFVKFKRFVEMLGLSAPPF